MQSAACLVWSDTGTAQPNIVHGIWYRKCLQVLEEKQPWSPPPLLAGKDNIPNQPPIPRVDCTTSLHTSVITESLLPQERWEETRREISETRRAPSHLHFSSVPGVTSGFMQVLPPVRWDYFPSPTLPWFGHETKNPLLTQLYSLIKVTFFCFPKFLMFLSLHNWAFTLQKSITWGSGGRFGKVWVPPPPPLSFKFKKQEEKTLKGDEVKLPKP